MQCCIQKWSTKAKLDNQKHCFLWHVILMEVEHFIPELHWLNIRNVKIMICITSYSQKTFSYIIYCIYLEHFYANAVMLLNAFSWTMYASMLGVGLDQRLQLRIWLMSNKMRSPWSELTFTSASVSNQSTSYHITF